MAKLDSTKSLFFTTSPRTPNKMIPELTLLYENNFSGKKWNKENQELFIDLLSTSDFFEGVGSSKDKAFSARDRINRAPQSLGFIDLKPVIQITEAGKKFILGKRPQEIFLRQILKFQLPSPYHKQSSSDNIFYIKPYLEILRLIRVLSKLSFDEIKIFAMQLTDYRKFDVIKNKIIEFRKEKKLNKINYKKFIIDIFNTELISIYQKEIDSGNIKTRQSNEISLDNFLKTKRNNLHDYTDAMIRYLRFTGLINIHHHGRSISCVTEKLSEIDFILNNIDRNPVHLDSEKQYKEYLFNINIPVLYDDDNESLMTSLMKLGNFTKNELKNKKINELKDIRDLIVRDKKQVYITEQVRSIKSKSYDEYQEIIDTYQEIISKKLYDVPLMFEWNTWKAMTFINGGNIKGNFILDDFALPMSTAPGNLPDIVCDYNDFILSVEVTMQRGQRQYESESEPVSRHLGKLVKENKKDVYCLFVAPQINVATLAHFYILNKTNVEYYGGKTKIIPLDLDNLITMIDNAYNASINNTPPQQKHIKEFLDLSIDALSTSNNENEWFQTISNYANSWQFIQ